MSRCCFPHALDHCHSFEMRPSGESRVNAVETIEHEKRETDISRRRSRYTRTCAGEKISTRPQVILEAQEVNSVGLRGRRNATCGADLLNCTTREQRTQPLMNKLFTYLPFIAVAPS